VNKSKGKDIITGFCTIYKNFDPPASLKTPVPVICPGIHLNVVQVYESFWRAKRLADVIIPMHEPSLVSIGYI